MATRRWTSTPSWSSADGEDSKRPDGGLRPRRLRRRPVLDARVLVRVIPPIAHASRRRPGALRGRYPCLHRRAERDPCIQRRHAASCHLPSPASPAASSGPASGRPPPACPSAAPVVETSAPSGAAVLRRGSPWTAALEKTFCPVAWEWQWDAAHMPEVPDDALRSAAAVRIAVIDSGADLGAPDVGDKQPGTGASLSRTGKVRDVLGHGTFVVATRGRLGHQRRRHVRLRRRRQQLLGDQAIGPEGYITDVDEAAAIVYAVRHGARIINLSIGGEGTSAIERRALRFAVRHDVLIVAAAGNAHDQGNPVQYPAALLGGKHGAGFAVGATSMDGTRVLLEHGLLRLAGGAGGNVFAGESASSDWRMRRCRGSRRATTAGRAARRSPPRGRRCRRARLGRRPAATARAGRVGVEAQRHRQRLESAARLGHAERGGAVELARVTPGKAPLRVKRSRRRP